MSKGGFIRRVVKTVAASIINVVSLERGERVVDKNTLSGRVMSREKYTLDKWPESAKTGDYLPWEPDGKNLVEEKTSDVWEENAPLVYQNKPSDEQRSRCISRFIDSWIWRLKREETAVDPGVIFAKIRTNGPFSYVEKECSRVDLFFDLTLASSISDGEEKGVEEFGKRYGDGIKAFAQKMGEKDLDAHKELENKDSDSFTRWLRYFLFCAEADLRNYRGIAPLFCYLRASIYRRSVKARKEDENPQEKQQKLLEKLTHEKPGYEESDPQEHAAQNSEAEKVKKALLELQRESNELYQVLSLHYYKDCGFAEIASEMGYVGRENTVIKKARRRCDQATARLRTILKRIR